MSDLREELLEAFREEYREHLDGIRTALAAFDASGGTQGSHLEEAFRRAHSLKAAARVCDLEGPEALSHHLETLFARAHRGELVFGPEAARASHLTVEAIEAWAHSWEAGQPAPEQAAAMRALDQLLTSKAPPIKADASREDQDESGLDAELLAAFQMEHHEHLEGIRTLLAAAEAGESGWVDEAFRRAHSLKGCARTIGLRPAEVVGHRLESLFAQAREGTLHLTPEVVRAIHRGLDFIEDATACLLEKRPLPHPDSVLETISAISDDKVTRWQGDKVTEETVASPVTLSPGHLVTLSSERALSSEKSEAVRVSTDHLDRLLNSAEQLLTEGLGQDHALRELDGLRREAGEFAQEWEAARIEAGLLQRLAAAPETARLARFLGHAQERVRALVRHTRQVYRLQRQSSSVLHLLGRQLRQDVRRARTIPAEGVFQGFRKMLRDLAQSEGKEIDYRTTGLDVQADRHVLQALKDPLMHALRNAVCHGIEPPAERRRLGKEPAGKVSLALIVLGSRLHVLVEDDGRGVDSRAVAAEAVRQQLLTEAEAEVASSEELARLVFQPGFSTAQAVTDLAGRGMGLSVVHEAVTRLQGGVQLLRRDSGRGTRLRITVPLSVTAQRLLLIACQNQTFAIPAHGIEQLCRAGPRDIEVVGGSPMLVLQDEPVRLRSLAHLLGLGAEEPAREGLLSVVIVRSGSRRLAVSVDELLGARDALIKELGSPASQDDRWAGGILLEDGAVCLVLNPAALFDVNRPAGLPAKAASLVSRPTEKKTKTILVVDDSLTTRTLEKSILEAHGYRVVLALDGLEALARMRDSLPDLVISDVQMPRLDGFGLLEQMKKDPRLARLPVIIVTSLERREDQERGLALGADAYVIKRKFDHEELLTTVRQIL